MGDAEKYAELEAVLLQLLQDRSRWVSSQLTIYRLVHAYDICWGLSGYSRGENEDRTICFLQLMQRCL